MSNDNEDRAARLAEQLRANLRKRKQQARGEPADIPDMADGAPSDPAGN